jgi:transcriptional regulator of acetoin/glycerol metabolism/DNA-binding CsgD family transcriptional regulator
VLQREVGTRSLRDRLDDIQLASGFCYAEDRVGTNAIGTALAQRSPAVVLAGEHFADVLVAWSCAAAPVVDPRTGRSLGVVDLTCVAEHTSSLMLALAKRAAWEIEQRLLEDVSASNGFLLQEFLHARRGVRAPLVTIDAHSMFLNASAATLVQEADRVVLWEAASRALLVGSPTTVVTGLASGAPLLVRCAAIRDGGDLVGAVLQLAPQSASAAAPSPRRRADARILGWDGLTDTERSVATLVARGLTNREVASRVYLSPHTVGYHLRAVYRKLDIGSRVELTRVLLEHEGR